MSGETPGPLSRSSESGDPRRTTSLRCSLGFHRWTMPGYGGMKVPDYFVGFGSQIETECSRCGKRKIEKLVPGRLGD